MAILATILCALGIIGIIWGVMQKMKAARMNSAPFAKTGDVATKGDSVAGAKGAISAEGNVVCGTPLVSPVTGTACLYYELTVIGEWKEGDSEKSKPYVEEKVAAEFALDDGSGPVSILAAGGGDFDDLEKTFEESKKEGLLADLKSAVGKGKPIEFGKYAFVNPANSKASKFTCTERVLPVVPKMFALGKYEAGAITSPSFRSLVLSKKSRDELFGSATKASQQFIFGGIGALAVGCLIGVISTLGGGAKAEEPSKAATAAVVAKDVAPVVQAASPGVGDKNICEKTKTCCEVLNGAGYASCQNFTKIPNMNCAPILDGFKKSVAIAKPDQIKTCE